MSTSSRKKLFDLADNAETLLDSLDLRKISEAQRVRLKYNSQLRIFLKALTACNGGSLLETMGWGKNSISSIGKNENSIFRKSYEVKRGKKILTISQCLSMIKLLTK